MNAAGSDLAPRSKALRAPLNDCDHMLTGFHFNHDFCSKRPERWYFDLAAANSSTSRRTTFSCASAQMSLLSLGESGYSQTLKHGTAFTAGEVQFAFQRRYDPVLPFSAPVRSQCIPVPPPSSSTTIFVFTMRRRRFRATVGAPLVGTRNGQARSLPLRRSGKVVQKSLHPITASHRVKIKFRGNR